MKTLLTLALLCAVGCGAQEPAFLSEEVTHSPEVDASLSRALQIYADAGITVTPNYPIGVVSSIPGDFIAICVKGSYHHIAVSAQYASYDTEWLALVMVHEIGHCSFDLGHTAQQTGQVMSPFSPNSVDEVSSEAWSFFWMSVKASQGVNVLNN